MPSDDLSDHGRADAFPAEYPGTEEVPLVDWPRLWRERLERKVHAGDRYAWWVLTAALAGLFAAGFTITVVAVSLGTVADDLGTTERGLTWAVTGPLLAFAIVTPLFGKLGDQAGHRRVYLAGFAGFAVLCGATALAWNGPSLIAVRVLSALVGAATGPTSMALIMRAFPESERVKAMGWWSLVGAGAPVLGLVAGGPVVDALGWRWIFVAQAIFSLAALLLGVVVLRETPRREGVVIDVAGAVLLGGATVSTLLALDRGDAWGWSHPVALTLAIAGPVLAVAFVSVERRAGEPLLPLSFFRRRNFTASLVAQFASNFAYMGGFIITPLLVQDEFGFTVTATALAMLFRPLTFSICSPAAGYLAVRVGERRTSVAGTALVVASMLGFALAAASGSVGLVYAGLALSGLGLGVASPSLVSSAANTVPVEDLGVANAAQSTLAQLGVVAGMQLLSTMQDSLGGRGGFVAAYLAGALAASVGVVGASWVRSAERAPRLRVARAA